MGQAKHLLELRGTTALERLVCEVAPLIQDVSLVGAGAVPPSLASLRRIYDAPDARGPVAGILAALRQQPPSPWLILACDMPRMHRAALAWILSQRNGQHLAVIPQLDGRPQPFPGLYEPAALVVCEEAIRRGGQRAATLLAQEQAHRPTVPEDLRDAWRNVNTPEDWLEITM